MRTLSEILSYRGGQIRRQTPGRCTQEIVRPGTTSLFLKQYRTGFREGWRSPLAQMEAERAAFATLAAKGMPIPHLLDWGGARGQGAYLLWEGCQGEPLDSVLAKGYPDPGSNGKYRAKKELIVAAAQLVRRLHDLGLVHRDLYLCHLLYAGVGEDGPRLCLIDLQRVTKKRLRRWYVKDLAALCSSCPEFVSRADRLRFLLSWEGKRRADTRSRSWAKAVLAKSEKIRGHKPKYG